MEERTVHGRVANMIAADFGRLRCDVPDPSSRG